MAQYADVSFEVAHLYLGDRAIEQTIERYADAARTWALPIVSQMREDGDTVSVVVFLDDYTDTKGEIHPADQVRERVVAALQERGLKVDYVALESECAKSAHILATCIEPAPVQGDGSVTRNAKQVAFTDGHFVHYFGHSVRAAGAIAEYYGMGPRSFEQRTDIGLRVRLHGETGGDFTCPAVAAWWQLIRLGALLGVSETRAEEEGYKLSQIEGAPHGTWARPKAAPFIAKRTVTLLPPAYIGVEHAVQVLLDNAGLPERLQKSLGITARGEKIAAAPRDRISYLFADAAARKGAAS